MSNKHIKVIVDNKIPFIKGVLEPYADVKYIKGTEIRRNDLMDIDALLIRTRTLVNRNLLESTAVKFVGTATIGTDHIDTSWCHDNNIHLASAPGCNSGSVMQYIAASLAYLNKNYGMQAEETTLGIIGVGNVGSKVAQLARTLGYKVLLNDPPREKAEGSSEFSTLKRVLEEADITSIHVPLTYDGIYPTINMVNKTFLNITKKGSVLINTSRGQVVDEQALIKSLNSKHLRATILDVWNNEPELNLELLSKADIGTPHIAGYSVDGKANGSTMIINQLASYFKLPLTRWRPGQLPLPSRQVLETNNIFDAILDTYPILEDSDLLKASPGKFEELRGNYRIRREFETYKVKSEDNDLLKTLGRIGFRL